MSIAAPMLVISLIIYAGLFGLFIYLVTKKDGNLFAFHPNAAVDLAANSAQPVLSDTNAI